jgi:hypothetical protein
MSTMTLADLQGAGRTRRRITNVITTPLTAHTLAVA